MWNLNLSAVMLSGLLFFACGGDGGGGNGKNDLPDPDPTPLKEEIATLKADLDLKAEQLNQRRWSIEVQGRGLMPSELEWLDRFGGWMFDYEAWKKAWEAGGKDSSDTQELEAQLESLKKLAKRAEELQA